MLLFTESQLISLLFCVTLQVQHQFFFSAELDMTVKVNIPLLNAMFHLCQCSSGCNKGKLKPSFPFKTQVEAFDYASS